MAWKPDPKKVLILCYNVAEAAFNVTTIVGTPSVQTNHKLSGWGVLRKVWNGDGTIRVINIP